MRILIQFRKVVDSGTINGSTGSGHPRHHLEVLFIHINNNIISGTTNPSHNFTLANTTSCIDASARAFAVQFGLMMTQAMPLNEKMEGQEDPCKTTSSFTARYWASNLSLFRIATSMSTLAILGGTTTFLDFQKAIRSVTPSSANAYLHFLGTPGRESLIATARNPSEHPSDSQNLIEIV